MRKQRVDNIKYLVTINATTFCIYYCVDNFHDWPLEVILLDIYSTYLYIGQPPLMCHFLCLSGIHPEVSHRTDIYHQWLDLCSCHRPCVLLWHDKVWPWQSQSINTRIFFIHHAYIHILLFCSNNGMSIAMYFAHPVGIFGSVHLPPTWPQLGGVVLAFMVTSRVQLEVF